MSETKIDSTIRANRYGLNQESFYDLENAQVEWLQDLLNELEEGLDDDEKPQDSKLELELTIAAKEDAHLGDHLLISGKFRAHYHTPCVRCLIPAEQEISGTFDCCFLPHHLEDAEEYEETTEVFSGGKEYELYFTAEKSLIDLKELVHEQVYLEAEPLPLHDPDCKGLCMTCGANLNLETCPHPQPQLEQKELAENP